MSEDVMCYVASKPGVSGYSFAAVDEPVYAKENAKEIAKKLRMGYVIDRVSLARAQEGLREYFTHKKQSAA